MNYFVTILILLYLSITQISAAVGCVRATGKVYCRGEPYANAKIRLFDVDEIEFGPLTKILRLLNPDDLMEQVIIVFIKWLRVKFTRLNSIRLVQLAY